MRLDAKPLPGLAPPAPRRGAPLANLPDLSRSRARRTSPQTGAPSPTIQANLLCADCDPSGGGGAGGSDPYFGAGRTRPLNETGRHGETLGSRNFNWDLPLVGLRGRAGLDLSLTLYYNSLVWTKQGGAIQYNADHGTPAPGFQLGLPRLQAQYYDADSGAYAHILVTPSGGRVKMKQVGSGVFESADGSYTQLTFSGGTPVVRTKDGTQHIFGTQAGAEWRCTQIKDRNGNYLSATYNATNGHLLTLTDTLGRVVNFNYDGNGNLSTITQTWGGATHNYVTFIYDAIPMSPNFSGLTVIGPQGGQQQTVLAYIALTNNESYHFDYNAYGQVYQIRHKAPDGHELERTSYIFNLAGAQTDCPRFTERRDTAQEWNNGLEAVTSFSVTDGVTWTNPEMGGQETGTRAEQTLPDGTTIKQFSHTTGWDAGLPRLGEYWSGGARKKHTSTQWTQDNTGLGYQQNPRPVEINIYDAEGNRRRTTIDYTEGWSLPTHVREWGGANADQLLRLTATSYKLDSVYLDRRLIGLPYQRIVYDGPTGAIKSRVAYHYDWGDPYFTAQAPATQHDTANYPSWFVVGRGNLVAVRRYDCASGATAFDENLAM